MWPRDIELEKLSVVTEGGVTDGPTTQLPLWLKLLWGQSEHDQQLRVVHQFQHLRYLIFLSNILPML
jgi:hypothetical protein